MTWIVRQGCRVVDNVDSTHSYPRDSFVSEEVHKLPDVEQVVPARGDLVTCQQVSDPPENEKHRMN